MPRKNKNSYKEGDILLLTNGELALVESLDFPSDGSMRIQKMTQNESSFVDVDYWSASNLGQAPEVVAQFHIGYSIHKRLNKLHGV